MKPINTKSMIELFKKWDRIHTDVVSKKAPWGADEKAFADYKAAVLPLETALKEAQGRATTKTLEPKEVFYELSFIEDRLPRMTKKDMEGITISVDPYAQDKPRAYKYTMVSTQFSAIYKGGSWRITEIRRAETRRSGHGFKVTLTEQAKAAILNHYELF